MRQYTGRETGDALRKVVNKFAAVFDSALSNVMTKDEPRVAIDSGPEPEISALRVILAFLHAVAVDAHILPRLVQR